MIVVYLQPGTSSDKTIDALYAFTDCELPLSPNCCVIYDDKPHFIGVSDVLRSNAESTKQILKAELSIQLDEVNEQLHFASLEKSSLKSASTRTASSRRARARTRPSCTLTAASNPGSRNSSAM